MADLTPSERLQPCLLDRVTDLDPGSTAESRERRVFSLRQVRAAVLRDLAWLFNASRSLNDAELEDFPQVRGSVLNYGLPDLCGVSASGLDLHDLEEMIRAAVERFEPRLIPGTLEVRATRDNESVGQTAIVFEIRGDLWAQPVPDPLYLKTEVDLESGQCSLRENTRG